MNKFFVAVAVLTFFVMAFLITGVVLAVLSVSPLLCDIFYYTAAALAIVILVMWLIKYKSYFKNGNDNEKNG